MRRKITFAILGVVALALGAHYLSASRTNAEVQRLIGEARSRGIYTDRGFYSGTDQGADVSARLYGIDRISELRRLDVQPDNVTAARELIASVEPYFSSISEFAKLESYGRRRSDGDPRSFDDMSPIASAIHAEGWRGYLLATDGKTDEALAAVRNLKGFMERVQDERFAIGSAMAGRARDRLSRILLKLAEKSTSAQQVDRLLLSAKTMPEIKFKESFAASLSGSLEDIDKYERGDYDFEEQSRVLGIRFSIGRTAAHYDAIRRDVLEHAIKLHDNWEKVEMDLLSDDSLDITDLDLGQQIVATYAMVSVGQLRLERNDTSNRRALLLTLAAYKHRLSTGNMPTVADIEKQGFDATDPWGGEKMTLHQEGKRIWVGGMRKDRKTLQPSPVQTMEILEWRP